MADDLNRSIAESLLAGLQRDGIPAIMKTEQDGSFTVSEPDCVHHVGANMPTPPAILRLEKILSNAFGEPVRLGF